MFCFFSLFLALSHEAIPKYSMVFVSDYYDEASIDEMNKQMKDAMKNLDKVCDQYSGDYKRQCKEGMDAIQGFHYANSAKLDSVLSKVSKKTEYLFFMGIYIGDKVINFNKLSSSMEVFFINVGDDDYTSKDDLKEHTNKMMMKLIKRINKINFDGSKKSAAKLSQKFITKNNKKVKSSYVESKLVGNIGGKVHFITFVGQTIRFVDAPCNCETIFLVLSNFDSNSEMVNSKFLLVDPNSNNDVKNSEVVKVGQYCLYLFDAEVSYNFRVSYYSDSWRVFYSDSYIFNSYGGISVPYERADSFAIYVYSFYIDINVYDTSLEVYSKINVTVIDWDINTESPFPGFGAKALEKKTVKIVTSGDWDSIENKPSLILTTDSSEFEVDDGDSDLKVDVQKVYTFKSKKSGPNVGLIVGIVVAVVVVIVIVVVVVIIVLRKKKQAKDQSSNEGANDNEDKA